MGNGKRVVLGEEGMEGGRDGGGRGEGEAGVVAKNFCPHSQELPFEILDRLVHRHRADCAKRVCPQQQGAD